MISRAPGWSWNVEAGVVTLAPRGDLTRGRVRYRERVQPLRAAGELVQSRLLDGTCELHEVGAVELVTTDEGEYAAIGGARGTCGGTACERTVGVVLADDWYAEVDALALGGDQFAAFATLARTLLQRDRLQLGVRRRAVRHRPRAGWRADTPLPMFARYRNEAETLVVYPALPVPADAREGFELLPGPPAPANIVRALLPRTPIVVGQLAGSLWELEIRDECRQPLARRIAMLRDDRYLYAAYLDVPVAALAARRAILDELLASIDPIPAPVRASQPHELFVGLF